MELLDHMFLNAAFEEALRSGLFIAEQRRVRYGCIVQQTWLDPVYAYCGAAT